MTSKFVKVANVNTFSNGETVYFTGKSGFKTTLGTIPILCSQVTTSGANSTNIILTLESLPLLYDDNHQEHVLDVNNGEIFYNLSNQESNIQGFAFSSDLSYLYSVGKNRKTIDAHKLSVARDISTSTHLQNPFYIGNKESAPTSFYISKDGAYFYILGIVQDSVIRYEMSTPWLLTGAKDIGQTSIFQQTDDAQGVFLDDIGSKMYVANTSVIYQYSLPDSFNTKSASFLGKYFIPTLINPFNTEIRDLYISPNGQKLFVADSNASSNVYCYNLDTAWDISTANYISGNNLVVGNSQPSVRGLFLSESGNSLYIVGDANSNVHKYTLSTNWDLRTANYSSSRSILNKVANAVSVSPRGDKLYVLGSEKDSIEIYNLPNLWNLSNSYFANANISISNTTTGLGFSENNPSDIFIQSTGSNVYAIGQDQSSIFQYSLNSNYDFSLVGKITRKSIANTGITFNGLYFKPDGNSVFVTGNSSSAGYIYKYDLSRKWNVASATLNAVYNFSSSDTKPHGIYVKQDGTQFYTIGKNTQNIYQYTMSTPWSLSSATSNQLVSINSIFGVTSATGIHISDTGVGIYISDEVKANIYQGYLTTSWNIATTSYSSTSFEGSKGYDYITVPVQQKLQSNLAPGQVNFEDGITELSVRVLSRSSNTVTINNSNTSGTLLYTKIEQAPFYAKLSQHISPDYFNSRTAFVEGSTKKIIKTYDIRGVSGQYTANLGVKVANVAFVEGFLDRVTKLAPSDLSAVDDYNVLAKLNRGYSELLFYITYYNVPIIEKGDTVYIDSTSYSVSDVSYDATDSDTFNSTLTSNSLYKITLDKNITSSTYSGSEIINVGNDLVGYVGNVSSEDGTFSIDYDKSLYSENYNLSRYRVYSVSSLSPFRKIDLPNDRTLRNMAPTQYAFMARNINSYGRKSPFSTTLKDLRPVPIGAVSNLQATENIYIDTGKASVLQLIISFEPIDDSAIDYELSYKIIGAGDLDTFNTVKLSRSGQDPDGKIRYVINNVDSGKSKAGLFGSKDVTVIIKVTPLSADLRGITEELTHQVTGKSQNPQGLDNFSVVQANDVLTFRYKVPVREGVGLPVDLDLDHIDIRRMKGCCSAPSLSDFLSAETILRVPTPSTGTQILVDSYETYTFMAKTFDTSGNYSDFTANGCIEITRQSGLTLGYIFSEDDPSANTVVPYETNSNYSEFYWPSFSNSNAGGLTYSYSSAVDMANGSSNGWSQGTDGNSRTLYSSAETSTYITQIRNIGAVNKTSLIANFDITKTFDINIANTRYAILSGTSEVSGNNEIFVYPNISSYFAGASYNTTQQTLANNGINGNVFVIWNTNLGSNNNSYALISGVINTNAIALGASYYANGVATGSNTFANLTLHSGSFELADVYQTSNTLLGNNFVGIPSPIETQLYARFSSANTVYDSNGNVSSNAFSAYTLLDSQERSFKFFQLKLVVNNLYPRLVTTKLDRLTYFTKDRPQELVITEAMNTNPKNINLVPYGISGTPTIISILPTSTLGFTMVPVISNYTSSGLTLRIFNRENGTLPTGFSVRLTFDIF